ncbi:IS110 family RNA-guided transposase [Bacillus testis]|uniref:IS110 family transposase n=1 Tax=Bacillus testis TaxID=1622072 RepID=UPI00067F384A|nr:IS110 family transposase [Bacillus testis]
MKHVIAFDVSMGKSYMVIYNSAQKCEYEGDILHTRPSFNWLKDKVEEIIQVDGEQSSIVFESTGVYSRPLERFFRESSLPYCLLNPLEAKKQCDSLRIHKTDRSDAHRLALTHFKENRRVETPSDDVHQQLKSLSRLYDELDKELSMTRNRLHKVLQLTFPELDTLFSSKSELFLQIVQLFPHPDLVLAHSKTVIKNKIIHRTRKRLSKLQAEQKAIELLEAARNSYPAVHSMDVVCDQVRLYAQRYLDINEQKEDCITKMMVFAQELEEYPILLSIPGIGPNTAVRLIAEIGNIHRFTTHKQLNAYAGIDIRRFQSGKTFYRDKINKRGNKHLRKLLYLIIQNMIKQRRFGHNHIVNYYDKLKMQPYNKCHKVASIACVNKLLKNIFFLITHHVTYDFRLAA